MEDLNETKVLTKERESDLFYTLAFSIFAVTLFLFYFDLGPPLPPFYRWEKSSDCHSLQFDSFRNDRGFLNFSFRAEETFELPREYLPNLVNIEGFSDFVNVTYFGSRVANRTQSGNTVNVIVPHQFVANFSFTIKCMRDIVLTKISEDIREVSNVLRGSSVSKKVGPDTELFNNVCLSKENGKIHLNFFSYLGGSHESFLFGAENNLEFTFYEGSFYEFTDVRAIHVNRGECILAPSFDTTSWQLILFSLPAVLNAQSSSDFGNFELFVPRSTSAAAFVSPRVRELPDIMCFESLAVAQFPVIAPFSKKASASDKGAFFKNIFGKNKKSKHKNNYHIMRVLQTDFGSFRAKYVVNFVEKQNVAVSAEILTPEFKDAFLRDVCPKCKLTTFDGDFAHLSDVTNRANVLIGNHISNLAQTAMLNPGTHVVDCSPRSTACNAWAAEFAAKFGVNYHSIWQRNETNGCECNNFKSCYPESPEKLDAKITGKIKQMFLDII